jgi:hypothetical protein
VSEDTTIITQLGRELQSDLVIVFLGLLDELYVPIVLERFGLLAEIEVERIYQGPDLTKHGERVLRPIVQRAYYRHYGSSHYSRYRPRPAPQ